ncbi:MAG: alpha-amylase family glycosyl hydrolase [Gaiellaceae bacterium]
MSGRGRRAAGAAVVLAVALTALPAAAGDQPAPAPEGDELAALAIPPPQSTLSSQRIYFVLTDRFANGSTSNDRGGVTGAPGVTGLDTSDPGYFHGGDLAGLTARLSYMKRLGMTAVWVTPPVVQRTVQGTSAGYHGYWGVDFTDIDPHLGTRDDFGHFVERAHAQGLKVFLDVVVNHTGDVVGYSGAGAAGAPYVDQATKPYRDTKGKTFDPALTAGTSEFPDLYPDDRSFPYRPAVAEADADLKRPEWLNDVRNYHNRGDSSFSGESNTYGDFYGLDDLFTERPDVVRGEIDLWSNWIRDYRLDGFRLDTVRHVNPAFWRAFLPAVQDAAHDAGVEDFSIFGEVFDQASTASTVRRLGMQSVLDFSFASTVVPYAAGIGSASDLANLFDQDDQYTTASSTAYDLATFLGNHDIGRVGFTLLRAASWNARRALPGDLLAHDLLFLLRGAPVVYYGDEVGMTGSGEGTDKEARQDMFPTEVAAWRVQPRIGGKPVGGAPSYDLSSPVARRIVQLSALVTRHPALRNGPQITRLAGDDAVPGVFAASRIDTRRRHEYVVAFNNGTRPRTVLVPTSSPRTRFAQLWPTEGGGPSSDVAGRVSVRVPARSSTVLRANRALPPARSTAVTLAPPVLDPIAGLFRLLAKVPGTDPGSVTFAFRSEGTNGWVRLGTDGARPFRLVLEPGRFTKGRPVSLVAIARTSSGTVAVSTVRTIVRR